MGVAIFDSMIVWLVRIAAWAVQIGAILLVAFILSCAVRAVEEAVRKKKVRLWPRFIIALLLICVILAVLALNPPVICPERYERYLTPERYQAVQSGCDGIYSVNIPLIPVCAKIIKVQNFIVENKMEFNIEYEVYYFCFGRMVQSYSTHDGYSVISSLF